jgi:hypothetical protein
MEILSFDIAGISSEKPLTETTIEDWHEMLTSMVLAHI